MNPSTDEVTPADLAIENAWKEAYRQVDAIRSSVENATIKIVEIVGDGLPQHHIVVQDCGNGMSTVIRTELEGDYRTRFLALSSDVVAALQLPR